MDPLQNPFIKKSGYLREDADYIYYRDIMNKVRKVPKHNPNANKKIRLKFLEKAFFFWRRLQVDQKGNIIAFSLFLTAPWVVYKTSIYFSERAMKIQQKATLPEEMTNKDYFKEYLKKKKEREAAEKEESI